MKFLYERIKNKTPKINAWFAFPAIESFALASLGYLSIFKQIDLMEDVFVEMICQDTKTTAANVSAVDVIGFSNSFEIDILTIFKILKKFDIPPLSKYRGEDFPLIFAGGPVMSANPLPFEDFYDFINIGDGKEAIDKIFKVLVEKKDETKEAKLRAISEIEGVWVPRFGKEKKIKRGVDSLIEPVATPILSEKSYFKDAFIVEIERGCPKMCNFCLASWLNLPVRFVDTDKIIETIDFGLKHTRKIALLGAYVAGHPEFNKILSHIRECNKIEPLELSLSSLRADLAEPEVIKTLVECGQKTATIAVEAGSERLRRVINKDLTDAQISKTVENARVYGLRGLKIYAMIGLPTENEADIQALVNLMTRLKQENKGFDLSLTLSTFVPKAHTPFERCKKASTKELEEKIEFLKKNLAKIGVDVRPSSVQWDLVQAILSRAPFSLSEYLTKVVENGGNLGAFRQVWRQMSKEGLLPDMEELACSPVAESFDEPLPWDFIEANNKELLKKSLECVLKSS